MLYHGDNLYLLIRKYQVHIVRRQHILDKGQFVTSFYASLHLIGQSYLCPVPALNEAVRKFIISLEYCIFFLCFCRLYGCRSYQVYTLIHSKGIKEAYCTPLYRFLCFLDGNTTGYARWIIRIHNVEYVSQYPILRKKIFSHCLYIQRSEGIRCPLYCQCLVCHSFHDHDMSIFASYYLRHDEGQRFYFRLLHGDSPAVRSRRKEEIT